MPISVGGQPYATLRLTAPVAGEFTSDDEILITALADVAGIAIQNARRYDETEQRRRWQLLSTETTQQMFANRDGRNPLDIVLTQAMRGGAGDLALLGLIIDEEHVVVEAAVGALAEVLTGGVMRLEDSVSAPVLLHGKPALVTDYSARSKAAVPVAQGITSVMIAPLLSGERIVGALTVGRLTGGQPFTESELARLTEFANQAGMAIELTRSRADHETVRLLQNKDRIAAELCDHVVRDLFATGMGLQAMVGGLEGEDQARVLGFVENLDQLARQIRNTIYRPDQSREAGPALQDRLQGVVADQATVLGSLPVTEFAGLDEVAVPIEVADDSVAVLREVLSNIARNGDATSVHVQVACVDGQLTIDIADNGTAVGRPSRSRASKLTATRRRAERRGGRFDVLATPGGTRVHWAVPIDPADRRRR